MRSVNYLGHYINGRFERAHSFRRKASSVKKIPASQTHVSPADFDDVILTRPKTESAPLDFAMEKGKEAYLPWAKLSLKERARRLSPLKKIIKKDRREIAQIISRETGKPLWESEGEAQSLLGKIDFVLGDGLSRIRERADPQAPGRVRFKSRGLLAVIGPFNFPMHLPLGQILPALIAGNSVVFKPSEKTPASGQKLAECLHKLNLPAGVFQMLQGGAKVSERLCRHKQADGALFTGSFETGHKLRASLLQDYSKILALEMGGYNSALIWDTKDKRRSLLETLKGCFWSAGQRCSATSQIILHKKIAGDWMRRFVRLAQKIEIDHWSKNPLMGPVIDESSVRRFFSFQRDIQKRGGEILLKGQRLKKEKRGYYVSPGVYKMKFSPSSNFGTKETFAPQAVIYETDDLGEALEMINHSGYGLSLSVFSADRAVREEMFYRAKVGLINYNLSSAGASGRLPFGGLGKSGNDRPAGAFAIDACVSPLAERSFCY